MGLCEWTKISLSLTGASPPDGQGERGDIRGLGGMSREGRVGGVEDKRVLQADIQEDARTVRPYNDIDQWS